MEPNEFLKNALEDAKNFKQIKVSFLSKSVLDNTNTLVNNEETCKGVFTAYLTSLTYKNLHKEQDVRYHKIDLPNGYSGRSFDTKYVTPFLKKNNFAGAMKESGWLTRSIEQDAPFNMSFPGKIQNLAVKKAFLENLDYLEKNPDHAYGMIYYLLNKSYLANLKRNVIIVKPIIKESDFQIPKLMGMITRYFNYPYKTRGASILPVLSIYAMYECMMKEIKRYDDCVLDVLSSHNSCDKSSGETGDIVVRKESTKEIYEVVEIKFNIKPTSLMITDVYKKIANVPVQRYYILSTVDPDITDYADIEKNIQKIRNEHGCEIIIDKISDSLSRTLRLFKNVNDYTDKFVNLIQNSTELNTEHKTAWNDIVESYINGSSVKIS